MHLLMLSTDLIIFFLKNLVDPEWCTEDLEQGIARIPHRPHDSVGWCYTNFLLQRQVFSDVIAGKKRVNLILNQQEQTSIKDITSNETGFGSIRVQQNIWDLKCVLLPLKICVTCSVISRGHSLVPNLKSESDSSVVINRPHLHRVVHAR